ncbi:creatininase family protein [Thetidibacter halocola]|uniref:Creatininase family protein n=1 Tax=Thetidibacter halocola TaxID=2827239 RepID=A0A8J8B802_9RHOB|nr:creatininase family protein [Thetidibacter halocola]MBS0124065.1 creatininase family protein [Thetidibacter halocola]
MRLDHMTWPEAEAHVAGGGGVILPVGSTEQHGPMGLIGTDAFCARVIAEAAAPLCGAVVAPTLALTPAPFNMGFPGTLSISEATFAALAGEVVDGLLHHGFAGVYVLNAHGANLSPLRAILETRAAAPLRLKSWWEFEPVNALRCDWYGDWEGMHATPSEVAITMAAIRQLPVPEAAQTPPRKLSADYIRAHSGDRHGPPDAHRRDFPDGRVGSHSALATPEQGRVLIDTAARAVARDYADFLGQIRT